MASLRDSMCRLRRDLRCWITTRAWRTLRDQVVYEEPLCTLGFPGCTVWSETADHIETVAARPDLMMERTNLRGACHSCNYLRGSAPNEILRLGWVA